jgi:predicted DNA-binding transcriptional regulator AlpA
MSDKTKRQIAESKNVCERTVDIWRARGLLPQPVKLGNRVQSRVRWTDAQVAELDRNLAALNNKAASA